MKTISTRSQKTLGLPTTLTVLLTILLSYLPTTLFGQGFFAGIIPLEDQFGIELGLQSGEFALPNLVDIDGDGDLDLFVNIDTLVFNPNDFIPEDLLFFENIGTNECPNFQGPESWPFGIPKSFSDLEFADIDGDGDLDLFSHIWGAYAIYFVENKGTAMQPVFGESVMVTNPFGINPEGFLSASITFCDMDGDKDYDILFSGRTLNHFQYQENIGSATNPVFSSRQGDPFGLSLPFDDNSLIWCDCLDWDCDGDLDILNAVGLTEQELYYYENLGTANDPDFSEGVATGDSIATGTHADLDGDGDEDILVFHYYARNITQHPGCVTAPVAAFSFGQTSENLAYTFINESTAQSTECNPVQWSWDFGDGTGSDEESPTHIFQEASDFNVCLFIEDLAGRDTFCTTIAIISGAAQLSLQKGIRLFPNPASTALYLTMTEEVFHSKVWVEIFDNLGQLVKRIRIGFTGVGANECIDIADLPAGMYAVKITDGEQFFTGEFVKTRE